MNVADVAPTPSLPAPVNLLDTNTNVFSAPPPPVQQPPSQSTFGGFDSLLSASS